MKTSTVFKSIHHIKQYVNYIYAKFQLSRRSSCFYFDIYAMAHQSYQRLHQNNGKFDALNLVIAITFHTKIYISIKPIYPSNVPQSINLGPQNAAVLRGFK